MSKITIFGAGALGGAFAAKLAADGGNTVTAIARGAHLEAIRKNGITLREPDQEAPLVSRIDATDDPMSLPKQDLVITGLKGHQLAPAADGLAHLVGDKTRVVMILNGIPWWYFHGDTGPLAERQFDMLDPGGALWSKLGPQRVIGCVAYQGAEVSAPGEIRLANKGRFIIGEPAGGITPDLQEIASLFEAAGIRTIPAERIRDHIWEKLMGNASFNPISALTRARMNEIMADDALTATVAKVMEEVVAVGESVGARFGMTVADRLVESRTIGPSRTSMLQDLLAGKALELVPLVGMVVEIGRLTGVSTPTTETIFNLVRQLDLQNRAE